MFRMFVLGALTLSAWSFTLERPNSEAQACRRRRCGGCYSGCSSGYGYGSGCGYAYNNCGRRSRSCCSYGGYGYSSGPQYTTASNCGYVNNSCGYAPQYNSAGTTGPQTYQGQADDVAPPPPPAPNTDGTTPPTPAGSTAPPAPAPGQP